MSTHWYGWRPRREIEELLRRCSKHDRSEVMDYLDSMDRHAANAAANAERISQENRDLHVIVKDQRNHIANLEAELLPHLKAQPEFEQGALA